MPSSSAPPVPALQNGDRLTRDEFERRYEAMPNVKKAELIEGTVYMPSPVHASGHGEPHAHLMTWLGTYAAATPGVRVADNATIRLDLDNEPQPDGLLRIDEDAGGQSRLSDDDYVEGPPELLVSIAPRSPAYDLHYHEPASPRNRTPKSPLWQIREAAIAWFASEGGAYLSLSPDEDGQIESRTFPGLVLDVDALLSDNFDTVLAALQEQTGTERHQAFVEQLAHQDDED